MTRIPLHLQWDVDGDRFSLQEVMGLKEWPQGRMQIEPHPGDPFYGILVQKAPKIVMLFTRAMWEYERRLVKMTPMPSTMRWDVRSTFVVHNSATLQDLLVNNRTEWHIAAADIFKTVIRKRYCPVQSFQTPSPVIRLVWTTIIPETITEAQARFDELRREGYRALVGEGSQSSIIDSLPVKEETVRLAPPRCNGNRVIYPETPDLPTMYRTFKQLVGEDVSFTIAN